jgi:hypothetical protein
MNYPAIIFFGLAIVGCSDSRWYHEFELDEATFDDEAMEMVAKDSGITIPDRARGIHFSYKPPIDPAFLAVIEIPEEAAQEVIGQIDAIKDTAVPSSTGGLDEKNSWWTPTVGQVLIDRSTFDSGRSLRAVLTRQNGRLLLYIDHNL